ncbi:MAG: hypothetical protein WHV44_09550 [Anaerolineales bacterium]
MKHAVSISLGSSKRDKRVTVTLAGEDILVERIGTDGDVEKARKLYEEMDGEVDAFGVGGVDLYLRLDEREYPLHAALKMVENVRKTPLCDGRGLKYTLERRVFELALPTLGEMPRFRQAFIPVGIDRLGLAQAVSEVADNVVFGDLMIALGMPLPIRGLDNYKRMARLLLPLVSRFPMDMLFYGSDGAEHAPSPKYTRYFDESDLIAGDYLFMRKYMPENMDGKVVITNTTTDENIALLKQRGVSLVITTTPRYEGRSFGTNMMEAMLTAYAGKGRRLSDEELNRLIDALGLRPTVIHL